MSKIICLTNAQYKNTKNQYDYTEDEKFYVNSDCIAGIKVVKRVDCTKKANYITVVIYREIVTGLGYGLPSEVIETPEQILKMME